MGLLLKNVLTAIFILLSFSGFSQENLINQFDAQGRRHGLWQKKYPHSDQLRYQGQFEHGKEIGIFKFYKKESGTQPAASRTYFPGKDSVLMRYYNADGFIISEGHLIDKKREGLWKYYFEKPGQQLMMTETYKNDVLDGPKTVYFENGKVTEKKTYNAGKLEGQKSVYDETGQLRQQYHYTNGILQGHSVVYDYKGRKASEGQYKNGLRDGKWKFYKAGKLDSVVVYPLDKKTRKAMLTKEK